MTDAARKIQRSRASVHTDTLTVMMDLSVASAVVEGACLDVLRLRKAKGGDIQPIGFDTFQSDCRSAFAMLKHSDRSEALHFATLVSAFLHECRHVHDLRGTRVGSELLLHDLRSYNEASRFLGALADLSEAQPSLRVPLPLRPDDLAAMNLPNDLQAFYSEAVSGRAAVGSKWTRRSALRTIPGHSIKDLFETLGFFVQMEWLTSTFGAEVADQIVEASLGIGPESAGSQYVRPLVVLRHFCDLYRVPFDPEPYDVPSMIFDALTVSGLVAAFDGDHATSVHPGAWFDRFCERFARLGKRSDCRTELRALYASEMEVQQDGMEGMSARIAAANDAIDVAQRDILGGLMASSPGDVRHVGAAILIASEVAIDFRDMQKVVHKHRSYHAPLGYAQLLLEGELTRVFVRVNTHELGRITFRTPSHIPTNHIGGSIAASEASQQMRILIAGREASTEDFFEDMVFEKMRAPLPDGNGLKFRRRPPLDR